MTELTVKDKAALATLYEFEEYKALKKYLESERWNIATKLLVWPPDDAIGIAKMQGQAQALKALHLELKRIHKDSTGDKS